MDPDKRHIESHAGALAHVVHIARGSCAYLPAGVLLLRNSCRRAIEDAETFEDRVSTLQAEWRERLGRVRANSAADLLIRSLPGAPIVAVSGAAELIGRTYQATNEAIDRLVEARILQQVNVGRRNRAFEAPELIRTFTDLERQLASPTGSTRSSPPTRRVPQRR